MIRRIKLYIYFRNEILVIPKFSLEKKFRTIAYGRFVWMAKVQFLFFQIGFGFQERGQS